MIDSGALATGFIDQEFAHSLGLNLQPLSCPRPLDMFDGTASTTGSVKLIAHCYMSIGNGHHTEHLSLFVTHLANYPIILGKGWLTRHNPVIDFSTNVLQFQSPTC